MQDSQDRHINSVDATAHQPLVDRVQARKLELEGLLAGLNDNDLGTKGDIGLALATVNELLTGDLANVPPVVGVDMNRWLERNKHLGERAEALPEAPEALTTGDSDGDSGEAPARSTGE